MSSTAHTNHIQSSISLSDPSPALPACPAPLSHARHDTPAEEAASALTHGLATLAALPAAAILIASAFQHGGAIRIASVALFATCMVAVYAASSMLHLGRWGRLGSFWLECDHLAIYLLIAGTYTPLVLIALAGPWGWTLFAAVWSLALIGIALRLLFKCRDIRICLAMYLLTGWVGLIAINPILHALSPTGIALILAGGLAYTLGVPVFIWRRLRFNHALWHAFVCLGTTAHALAIWHEVLA